jgi:hypothetical protein
MLAKSVENSYIDLNRGQVITPLSMCYVTTVLASLLPVSSSPGPVHLFPALIASPGGHRGGESSVS